MKKLLLSAVICSSFTLQAQQTITSVSNGNANNPLVWDCICFPLPGDEVIINHDITMNVDWLVSAGGSIHVSSSGSFIEDAQHRSILVDGAGAEFHNHGTTELTNMAFTNGALGMNHNQMSLDTGLWVGPNGTFMNMGVLQDVDSILVNGSFNNSGSLSQGDFWNTGTFTNSGDLTVDSLLNTGTFTSTAGAISCIGIGNTMDFTVDGTSYLTTTSGNFYNTGTFTVGVGRDVFVADDFWNGDTLGGTATVINDGLIQVMNDFWNADSLIGSGDYCIGQGTTNSGDIHGTLDICDNTGGGLDLNTGTVGASVTFCSSSCAVGIQDLTETGIVLYPNPTSDNLFFSESAPSFKVLDNLGRVVLSSAGMISQVDVSALKSGIYFINFYSEAGELTASQKFIKQ